MAFHFPDKGTKDAVKLSGMRSLRKVTVCLWMNSTNSKGNPFSYAVSEEDNELSIYYKNNKFQLLIGGENRLCGYYNCSGKSLS